MRRYHVAATVSGPVHHGLSDGRAHGGGGGGGGVQQQHGEVAPEARPHHAHGGRGGQQLGVGAPHQPGVEKEEDE